MYDSGNLVNFFHPTSPHLAIPLMAFTAEAHDIQRFGLVVRRQLAVIGTEDRESVVAPRTLHIYIVRIPVVVVVGLGSPFWFGVYILVVVLVLAANSPTTAEDHNSRPLYIV